MNGRSNVGMERQERVGMSEAPRILSTTGTSVRLKRMRSPQISVGRPFSVEHSAIGGRKAVICGRG